MTDLAAPDSTPTRLTRFGRSATETAAGLGPLADLVGTWMGSRGFELIAVPDLNKGSESFRLIVRPYVEVITFAPLGAPVPDRGGPAGDIFINGLTYDIRITDLQTNEPLHIENGMWLNLGSNQSQPIVRQGSVPHGNVFLALGASSTNPKGPSIPKISALPTSGPATQAGYTDAYIGPPIDGFSPTSPNDVLEQAIAGQEIVQTITLSTNTANGGGILSIPFVNDNAAAPTFACTYWIETVQVTETTQIQQLQYSQQTELLFIPQFGNPEELIIWPHVNVNTLLKQ